jgi:hypothetical protein
VEEDEGDTEREEQLNSDRVERQVNRVQDGRAEENAGAEEQDHPREPEGVGDELAREADAEDDRNRLDDVAGVHGTILTVASGVAVAQDASVFIVYLLPGDLILLLTLGLALYLTVIELRELRPHWKWWAWWLSFVFLTHFVGYLVLRGYVAFRRWHEARA